MEMEEIYHARDRIKRYLAPTPLLYSHLLQKETGKKIWLKLETQNPTGSFKPRPAFNGMLLHLEEAKKKGVIASSSGNFAQGVAYAAAKLGVSALIVMTESTSPYKMNRTKSWGAEIALSGDTHEERMELTRKLQKETGRVMLHPYNAEETVAGDGTIGLELSEQIGDKLDLKQTAVVVPVSGGGLIAGIAFVLKNLHPHCKIIGVQPEVSGTLLKSLQAGECVNVGKFKTVSDALVASKLGSIPFEIIQKCVDDAIQLSEDQTKAATRYMLDQHKLVVEPAAALPIAALLANAIPYENVICLISGGNIPLPIF